MAARREQCSANHEYIGDLYLILLLSTSHASDFSQVPKIMHVLSWCLCSWSPLYNYKAGNINTCTTWLLMLLRMCVFCRQWEMLTMQSFREPSLSDEVLTPASLPPSAASLTTRGRSLFNEVLMAIRTRHRACSNNPGTITIMYMCVCP
jgi:hypothetical protein